MVQAYFANVFGRAYTTSNNQFIYGLKWKLHSLKMLKTHYLFICETKMNNSLSSYNLTGLLFSLMFNYFSLPKFKDLIFHSTNFS